jgi:hypothetical protein
MPNKKSWTVACGDGRCLAIPSSCGINATGIEKVPPWYTNLEQHESRSNTVTIRRDGVANNIQEQSTVHKKKPQLIALTTVEED